VSKRSALGHPQGKGGTFATWEIKINHPFTVCTDIILSAVRPFLTYWSINAIIKALQFLKTCFEVEL